MGGVTEPQVGGQKAWRKQIRAAALGDEIPENKKQRKDQTDQTHERSSTLAR